MKQATSIIALFLLTAISLRAQSVNDVFGPKFVGPQLPSTTVSSQHDGDALHRWNGIAIDASGLDHTPTGQGAPHTFGEQVGPGRASRAMAIVHIAIFDVVNTIHHHYQSYTNIQKPHGGISMDAAIAQAAHDTLASLYPSQAAQFNALLATDLARIHNRKERDNGVLLGHSAATAILALRVNDGSEIPEPHINVPGGYTTSNMPGHWRQDPISLGTLALGAHWGECRTFVVTSGHQFRAPAPPAMTSPEYTTAFTEAKSYGGDGPTTPTIRSDEQTFIGTFWAYDGTPSLCAPPRLYNQIAVQLADQRHLDTDKLARLLALVNTAMADAGMTVWESKFYYDFWRPVTGIREAGTDGNNDTAQLADFTPLGAPASNLNAPNFTPPFPSYPSGHAGFGGALFETLRLFFGRDSIRFTFVSDEFNGVTLDHSGNARPLMPRTFNSLSQAEEENGQSRIYLGIHWAFDKTAGIAQGRQVADYVFEHAFQKLH